MDDFVLFVIVITLAVFGGRQKRAGGFDQESSRLPGKKDDSCDWGTEISG